MKYSYQLLDQQGLSLKRTDENGFTLGIPTDSSNSDYQQFLKDVAEQGIEIVEGPDIYEPSYAELRQQEYPPYSEQFDQIFHEGLDAWKETIQEIKDKYPKTITGGVTVGPVPEWVQEAVDEWILLHTPQEELNT